MTRPINITNDTTSIIKNITNATNGTINVPNTTIPDTNNTTIPDTTKPVDPTPVDPTTETPIIDTPTVPVVIPLPENGYRTTFVMEGDLDTFAQNGGEEAFIRMLAEQLGIDPSYININSVVKGSVKIEYDIVIPQDSGLDPEEIKEI